MHSIIGIVLDHDGYTTVLHCDCPCLRFIECVFNDGYILNAAGHSYGTMPPGCRVRVVPGDVGDTIAPNCDTPILWARGIESYPHRVVIDEVVLYDHIMGVTMNVHSGARTARGVVHAGIITHKLTVAEPVYLIVTYDAVATALEVKCILRPPP